VLAESKKRPKARFLGRFAVHFHVCAVDGVFEVVAVAGGDGADADDRASDQASDQARPLGVIFHPATAVDAHAVGQVQASLRRRILRAFVGRGLLECFEAKEMLGYKHSGFSVDTSVCIAAHDRAGLERLRKVGTSAKYWSTWGQRQSRRASPRHAGRRCRMTVMRKPVKPLSQSQTGMKRPKRCRTLRSISASVGELS
jgi:hypothetical protein